MELYFGETCRTVPQLLACKKRQLELWKDVRIEFNVEIYLRNYKLAFDITIYVIFIGVCSAKQKPFLSKR
jgi:hypothetical protein